MLESTNDQSDATQPDIVERLAELNRWQDEQKRLLEERQSQQRKKLGLDKMSMYEMLGLLQDDNLQVSLDSTENLTDIDNLNASTNDDDVSDFVLPEAAEGIGDNELTLTEPTTANTQRSSGYGSEPNTNQATAVAKPKQPFLRRGEGLKQRFRVDPEALRLDKLPRYKYANAHPQFKTPKQLKRGILKHVTRPKEAPAAEPTRPDLLKLDMHEKNFQKLLIGARNTCNSTPELKSADVAPHMVRFVEQSQTETVAHAPPNDTAESSISITGATWAKVLDTQQIKPVQVRLTTTHVEDEDNISIFELLEQKAREGSIDLNSSCMRAFLARKERQLADDNDVIPVSPQLKQAHLSANPPPVQGLRLNDDDDAADAHAQTDNSESTNSTPCRAQVRVRFSDSNDTHEYPTEDNDSDTSTINAGDESNMELLEQFKAALFTALEQKHAQAEAMSTEQTQTLNDELAQALQEKANLVKTRLSELEAEIATFKANNTELMRMKQSHELEKAEYLQAHAEGMEHLHDEKMQFEIYMHDERLKLDEDRKKFEQQMRLQKTNVHSKDRKEIASLKQEVAELQAQLKQKEQAHVAAQGRQRAQLRALEKEQRGFYDEIENLNKENKRLQMEALKQGRENNNKMLQEINRNIARLAPKLTCATTQHEPAEQENTQIRRSKSLSSNAAALPSKPSGKARQSGYSLPAAKPQRAHTSKKNWNSDSTTSSSNEENEKDSADELALTAELATPIKPYSRSKAKSPQVDKKAKAPPCAKADSSATTNQEYKREIVNADGSKDIWYPNGNLKKISADGMTVRMLYFNKDIKETDIRAGTVKYYYAETNTWHTTYLDGLEILEFPNGQTEHRHKNGTVEIHFPNNTIKIVDPADAQTLEEWRYADGTHLVQMRNGDKVLSLPNGQKEIHTKLNKRREYPDGTVKLVYPDGSQETRYSNGRVRLKDKDGQLIMDTDMAKY